MGNCFQTHLPLEKQEHLLRVQPKNASQKSNLIYSLENNQKIAQKIKDRFGVNLGKIIVDYLDSSLFCTDNLQIYELLLYHKNLDGCEKESRLLQPYLNFPAPYINRLETILVEARHVFGRRFIDIIPYIKLFHVGNHWDIHAVELRRFYTRDVMKHAAFSEEEFVSKSIECNYCWKCSNLATVGRYQTKTLDSDGDGSEYIKIEVCITWKCSSCGLCKSNSYHESTVWLKWNGRSYDIPGEHLAGIIDQRR